MTHALSSPGPIADDFGLARQVDEEQDSRPRHARCGPWVNRGEIHCGVDVPPCRVASGCWRWSGARPRAIWCVRANHRGRYSRKGIGDTWPRPYWFRSCSHWSAFGMEIIAWSENLTSEKAESHGARWIPKRGLFQEADILTSSAGFIMSTDWNGRRERLRASARVSLRITTTRTSDSSRPCLPGGRSNYWTARGPARSSSAGDVRFRRGRR